MKAAWFLLLLPIALQGHTERTIFLMGTIFHAESENAQEMEEMIRIVEESEARLSNWKEESEVTALNGAEVGRAFSLSETFCNTMKKLRQWQVSTDGAFDPFVGALTRPGGKTLAEEKAAWGMDEIAFDNCSILKKSRVSFDSGGFGKGEAIDRILERARKHNWSPFFLDFGGQVAVWKMSREVLLADPEERTELSGIRIRLTHGSVSTSGNSERPGHIFDPRTGKTVVASYSVTVWHPNAFDADVLSTALYVMGPSQGLKWATNNQIAAAFVQSPDLFSASPEFQELIDNDFHFQ